MNVKHPLGRKRKKGETAQLAAQLAPLEEQDARAAAQQGANGRKANNGGAHASLIQEHGALIVDVDSVSIMQGLGEGGRKKGKFLGIEPVVLVILIAALLFIAFIAWKISEMP